jgi:hypothetical protein
MYIGRASAWVTPCSACRASAFRCGNYFPEGVVVKIVLKKGQSEKIPPNS